MRGSTSTGKVYLVQFGTDLLAFCGSGTIGMKRTNGTFAGFLVCASKPTEALFLVVIRKADGAKPECPATFCVNAIRQLIQSDSPAAGPFPEQFDIDCVSVVAGVEVVRNRTDR